MTRARDGRGAEREMLDAMPSNLVLCCAHPIRRARRMFTSTDARHPVAGGSPSFEVGTRCMTKPMPESSCEMSIVAKAAGVRNFAEMLTCTE